MKIMLSMLVAIATFTLSLNAEAKHINFGFHWGTGIHSTQSAQDMWFYNETVRRFKHPDVQAHIYQRLHENGTSSLREDGVSGALRWSLYLGSPNTERAWSNQGNVTRTCREMRVKFVIEYRDWESRNRRIREHRTGVSGIVCTANGGRSWYQDGRFDVQY